MMTSAKPRVDFMRRVATFLLLGAGGVWGAWCMTRMPGHSYQGALPAPTPGLEALSQELARHLETLGGEIGERNVIHHAELQQAANYIEEQFEASGYAVERQSYFVRGRSCDNLIAERTGAAKRDEIVVIGAHYDSVFGSPGANDNATGVAAVLALARMFGGGQTERTLRFAAFVNEEPPFFWTKDMGSLVYAKACRGRGEKIVAMLSLETMGCYFDEPGSQRYPFPFSVFYPDTGNFIAFVGNVSSRSLVRRCVRVFRENAAFPSEGAAVPGLVPGVGWSDHWSFWKQGYAAVMVTDTAPYRYPYYHTVLDTPGQVDCLRLARVVEGLRHVVEDLCSR